MAACSKGNTLSESVGNAGRSEVALSFQYIWAAGGVIKLKNPLSEPVIHLIGASPLLIDVKRNP